MKIFTLYIGTSPHSPASPVLTPLRIRELLSLRFPSFTILPTLGVFRGNAEDTFVVKLTTQDVTDLLREVEVIRRELDQDGIGVEHCGRYVRVAEGAELCSVRRDLYPRVRAEYFDTQFRTQKPVSGWPTQFAVITARNPDGCCTGDKHNKSLDAELDTFCAAKDLARWSVTGGSRDFSHAEPGFGVECDLPTALAVGRRFRQEAIFWIQNGLLSLQMCDGAHDVPLGYWEARVLG